MPSLFSVCGYKIYFWSDEGTEPIHVHVSKGKPSPNGTKIWLTKNGGCIPANNAAHLSNNELNTLLEFISAQWFYICSEWQTHFIDKKIMFYC